MKCKNLIVITGMSCQGKGYIANQLRIKYGFYIIHTDNFYHPLNRKALTCNVGEESEEKNRLIREEIPKLTETTIIEGSHIGNQKELDIFIRELGFNGNIYTFKVESNNLKEQFASKHKVNTEKLFEDIKGWFDKIYDLKNAIIVSKAEDIINYLEIKDGHICISG